MSEQDTTTTIPDGHVRTADVLDVIREHAAGWCGDVEEYVTSDLGVPVNAYDMGTRYDMERRLQPGPDAPEFIPADRLRAAISEVLTKTDERRVFAALRSRFLPTEAPRSWRVSFVVTEMDLGDDDELFVTKDGPDPEQIGHHLYYAEKWLPGTEVTEVTSDGGSDAAPGS